MDAIELLECPIDDPQFDAKMTVLKENVPEDLASELKAGGAPRNAVPGETSAPAPID